MVDCLVREEVPSLDKRITPRRRPFQVAKDMVHTEPGTRLGLQHTVRLG